MELETLENDNRNSVVVKLAKWVGLGLEFQHEKTLTWAEKSVEKPGNSVT